MFFTVISISKCIVNVFKLYIITIFFLHIHFNCLFRTCGQDCYTISPENTSGDLAAVTVVEINLTFYVKL